MGTGDLRAELDAAFDSCALFDRSGLGRLLGTGPDLLDLLQRLSTGDVKDLGPGAGKPTVLTTPKGRIVERLFVHHLGEQGVLLVGGDGSAERVAAHLARYTFAEQIGLHDVTGETYQFAVVGPEADRALRACGAEPPAPDNALSLSIAGRTAQLLGQNGSESRGYSVTGPAADTGDVWNALAAAVREAGGTPGGAEALEAYRILRGIPASGHELTGEANPLEAGLHDAVSFDKGCYVGQEVVARLRTYDKVSRSLVGLVLPPGTSAPAAGTPLTFDGRTVGVLTSSVVLPGSEGTLALGFIKRKQLQPDRVLRAGENGPVARIVDLPFPRI